MTSSLRYAHESRVVEPKETPAQDGVGVIVGVLVGSGVLVGVDD